MFKYSFPISETNSKYRIIYDAGTVIVEMTPALNAIYYPGILKSNDFFITGTEDGFKPIMAQVPRVEGKTFVIAGMKDPVNCHKTLPFDKDLFCQGNIQLAEM